jgi:OOP family OmpA-OmpF porin
MKKKFLLAMLLISTHFIQAQLLKKIADRAKNRAESNVNKKVDNAVDKTVDDATDLKKDDKSGTENTTTNNTSSDKQNTDNTATIGSIKSYSKYDFVPGEKIVVYEDFMQDAVGDFPDKWNTNTSGETVTIEGKTGHWLKMSKGVFMPNFIDSLPENFTLEFDLLVDARAHSWGVDYAFVELPKRDYPQDWRDANNYLAVNLLPGAEGGGQSYYERRKAGTIDQPPTAQITSFSDITHPVHIAMWRQKERLRIYLNEDKTWDIPKAFLQEAKLNAFILSVQLTGDWHFYVNNLRLAVGNPDTRKKILEENKWVTHGILFDVNSDKIRPESYGSLKEIANVLKENADLKVKIVGHTDADGNDANNLDLSKRRAAAVKRSLTKEFGIDESRMETDGKGESEPIDKNDDPAGKANNRRVEFTKI